MPELLPVLRDVIDEYRRSGFRDGQFHRLGSGLLELANLSSESPASRLATKHRNVRADRGP